MNSRISFKNIERRLNNRESDSHFNNLNSLNDELDDCSDEEVKRDFLTLKPKFSQVIKDIQAKSSQIDEDSQISETNRLKYAPKSMRANLQKMIEETNKSLPHTYSIFKMRNEKKKENIEINAKKQPASNKDTHEEDKFYNFFPERMVKDFVTQNALNKLNDKLEMFDEHERLNEKDPPELTVRHKDGLNTI